MSAAHPRFQRGHCFQSEMLSKREVELVGLLLSEYLEDMNVLAQEEIDVGMNPDPALLQQIETLESALRKLDYPVE